MRSFVSVVILMTMSHNDGTSPKLKLNCILTKKHLADLTFIAKQPNALLIFIEAKFSRI